MAFSNRLLSEELRCFNWAKPRPLQNLKSFHCWHQHFVQYVAGILVRAAFSTQSSWENEHHTLQPIALARKDNVDLASITVHQIYSFQAPGVSLVIQCIFFKYCCLSFLPGINFFLFVSTKPLSTRLELFTCRHLKSCYFGSFKNVSLCTVLSIHIYEDRLLLFLFKNPSIRQTKWMHISQDISPICILQPDKQSLNLWYNNFGKFTLDSVGKRGNPNHLWYLFYSV